MHVLSELFSKNQSIEMHMIFANCTENVILEFVSLMNKVIPSKNSLSRVQRLKSTGLECMSTKTVGKTLFKF